MNYHTDCFWYHDTKNKNIIVHFCDWNEDEEGYPIPIDCCPLYCKDYINIDEVKLITALWQNREREENK